MSKLYSLTTNLTKLKTNKELVKPSPNHSEPSQNHQRIEIQLQKQNLGCSHPVIADERYNFKNIIARNISTPSHIE